MENLTVKDIVDLGMSGLSVVGLYLLWGRLNQVTDRLFGYLEIARQERHQLRNEVQVVKQGQEIMQRGLDNECAE